MASSSRSSNTDRRGSCRLAEQALLLELALGLADSQQQQQQVVLLLVVLAVKLLDRSWTGMRNLILMTLVLVLVFMARQPAQVVTLLPVAWAAASSSSAAMRLALARRQGLVLQALLLAVWCRQA
jgi:hypothetical protein